MIYREIDGEVLAMPFEIFKQYWRSRSWFFWTTDTNDFFRKFGVTESLAGQFTESTAATFAAPQLPEQLRTPGDYTDADGITQRENLQAVVPAAALLGSHVARGLLEQYAGGKIIGWAMHGGKLAVRVVTKEGAELVKPITKQVWGQVDDALTLAMRNPSSAGERAINEKAIKALREVADDVAPNSGFRVSRHVDMPSPRGGTESHHGIMSRWMKENFPKYNPDNAPAVLMDIEKHNATRRIFNEWRTELGGKIEWSKVSATDIRKLSERMFDAADVPASVRADYYKQFEAFLKTLQ